MPYPSIYAVTYSYTGFQQAQGDNSFPGTQIDADFAGVDATLTNLSAFMQSAIRSDGALQNGIVTYDSLSAALQSNGLAGAVSWATGVSFLVGVPVFQAGALYRCLIAHTSGVFATDLAAGKWLLLVTLPTGASSFRQGAGVPSAGLGNDGDSYLNTTTSDVYLKTAGAWAIVSNIKGLQGIQGVIGVTGNTGSTGPAAWTPPAAWITTTTYTTGPPASVVVQAGETYVCLVSHTAGVFATDLAAAKWIKVAQKGTGDLLSTNNLSDVTTPATARTNLGLGIGVAVQAFDAQLFSSIPQNSQSVNYTFLLTDAQREIFHPAADTTARVWTIPANASVAFPVGTVIALGGESASGVITLSITTDTLVWLPSGATGSRTLTAPFAAAIKKITPTKWQLVGVGIT